MNEVFKKTTPLVSVIMPVHNCEEYVTESINSILNQTYTNLELIILSTGSEDKTEDLISKIEDQRIKLIRLNANKGITYAFYCGINSSSGDFVTLQNPKTIYVTKIYPTALNL